VLSASSRESFHVALVEGAASGAVPVVRDWPLVARYGGPRAIFPRSWVVPDAAAAAARVLATSGDPATRAEHGAQARAWVAGRWTWERVAPLVERSLLPDRATQR
jgi:glycosyltransferase involved in cell wall biosynthesis